MKWFEVLGVALVLFGLAIIHPGLFFIAVGFFIALAEDYK